MNLGGAEILVIMVIGIMILGPDKLPSALRMFGKTMGEVKKYQDLAKGEISKAMDSAQVSFDPNKKPESSEDQEETVEPGPKKEAKKQKPQDKSEAEEIVAPILDEEE